MWKTIGKMWITFKVSSKSSGKYTIVERFGQQSLGSFKNEEIVRKPEEEIYKALKNFV